MALTDSQWAAAAADVFARLAAGTITEAQAATELSAATADWPTRTLSNAGLAEQLSRFKARVNGLLLVDGPPDPDLGGPNSVAIDLGTRIFYGPKVVSDAWPAGVPFAEGPPGPAVELRSTPTLVQWRVIGASSWIDLIALADLAGADGLEVELRVNATHIQWRLGAGAWTNLMALSALKGADGREVQMQTSATHIQWRYAGDAGWADLVALADITPAAIPGPAAWTPVFATQADGERRVQRIVDWSGGEGAKPVTGKYVGPAGPVDTPAEATDLRGAGGAGSGDMIAANNLSDLTDKASARTTLSVYSKAEVDATAGGKADLVAGKVPTAQLPALAITDVFEVATQAAMLALAAERGDVAIRTDENKSYVLAAEPPATLANWKLLRTPTNVVLSVAGQTGAITAEALKTALAVALTDVAGLPAALAARIQTINGSGPDGAGNISITAAGGALASDLARLALQIAELRGTLAGTAHGFADSFSDQTGIDAAASVNEAYNATNKSFVPAAGSTILPLMTSNSGPGGYAARASSEFGAGYAAWRMRDGVLTGESSARWSTADGISFPQWAEYTLPVAKAFAAYRITAGGFQSGRAPKSWTLWGSNAPMGGSGGTLLDTQTNVPAWADETRVYPLSGAAFDHYELRIASNQSGETILTVHEWQFLEGTNIDLRSVAYTHLDGVPSKASLTVLAKLNGGTMNTNVIAEISRDDGATWLQVTMAAREVSGGFTYYEALDVSLATLPSGSTLRRRLRTTAGHAVEVTGWALYSG